MSKRIHEHLRSNVVGYVAIFLFAVGGTAYATHPGGVNTISSADIINGEVKSVDVGTGEVQSVDIAASGVASSDIADDAVNQAKILSGAVRSDEIANNAVGTTEVLDASLGAGDLGPASVGSDEVADDTLAAADLAPNSVGTSEIQDQTVTGTDLAGTGFGGNGFNGDEEIIDGTITGFDIGANQLGGGHIADDNLGGADIVESSLVTNNVSNLDFGGCTADVHVDTICASATISLPYAGAVVANATGSWHSFNLDDLAGDDSGADDTTRVRGTCVLKLDGTDISLVQGMGEDVNAGNGNENHPAGANGTMALTGRGAAAAGAHAVDVVCRELDGDLDWSPINLTVQGSN